MKKIFFLSVATICFTLGLVFLIRDFKSGNLNLESQHPRPKALARIYREFAELIQSKNIPKEFKQVRQIRMNVHTPNPNLKELLQNSISLPFKTSETQKYIVIVDIIENFNVLNEALLIFQFNFFDSKTFNKEKEISRVFRLSAEEVRELQKKTRLGKPNRASN